MTITTLTPVPPGGATRGRDDLDEVIAQLAEAQEFLATVRPPVTRFYPTCIGHACASTAEVDEIAALIGSEARWIVADQYTTCREFGTSVYYRATYIVKDTEPQSAPGRETAPAVAA